MACSSSFDAKQVSVTGSRRSTKRAGRERVVFTCWAMSSATDSGLGHSGGSGGVCVRGVAAEGEGQRQAHLNKQQLEGAQD